MTLSWDHALITAAIKGNVAEVKQIVSSSGPFTIWELSQVAFHAARNRRTDVLQALLDEGWDINQQDPQSELFILAHAMRFHNENIIGWLLEHGADPNMVDGRGVLPLAMAAQFCSLSTVTTLIKVGAVVPGSRALTAAAVSCQPQRLEKLALLLGNGAGINDMELVMPWHRASGRPVEVGTALHAACKWGFDDSEEFLLQRGADPELRNWAGLRAEEVKRYQRGLAHSGWSRGQVSRNAKRRMEEEDRRAFKKRSA